MEDKKRKAGPIALDWGKLLPSHDGIDDDEPPPVVVIKAAEVQRPEHLAEAEMGGGDEDKSFATFSVHDLIDKKARMKSMLNRTGISLNDGGKKLRVSLESVERELEKRKDSKDGRNIKKATPLAGKSICVDEGTACGLSTGASITVPDSQSNFAADFCKKLGDESGHGRTESLRGELSTLNRCDQKNTSLKWQSPSMRTQKIGLSSKQSPFTSVSRLSLSIDKPRHSDGKRSRSRSSTPSPRHSDRDASGCFVKENAPRFQHSRRSRQNTEAVVLSEEEEMEDDVTDQTEKADQSFKETQIYYPSRDDPESIEIHYSDLKCLAPQSYLSSNIMNFYIRYVQKPTSPTARKRCDYHFFTTFFYKKLKQHVLNMIDREPSFLKLRKWWKGVNIFEKAYIFLPVHECQHWSLVIICIPDKEDESGPIMLHLDSLGLHNSRSIFKDVKSFLIEEWKFLRRGEDLPELPISDKVWYKLSRRIDEKVIEVPQQRNDYDCGLFVLFFMERFIDEAPERLKKKDLEKFGREWFRPEQASGLRRKIKDLLREEFKNANRIVHNLDP